MNKYNAHPFYFDRVKQERIERKYVKYARAEDFKRVIYFASSFEYEVYKTLLKYFPDREIVKDHPFTLLDDEIYANRLRVKYAPDFFVYNSTMDRPLVVEAKGKLTDASQTRIKFFLANFRDFYPNFQIVVPRQLKKTYRFPKRPKTLQEFDKWLINSITLL